MHKVGQLVQFSYKNGTWEYGIVTAVFDDRTEIRRESGGRTMWHSEQSDVNGEYFNGDAKVSVLIRDGKPVFAKRRLFGEYRFR